MSSAVSIIRDHSLAARALLNNPKTEGEVKLIRCHWVKGEARLMRKSFTMDISVIKDVHVGDFLKVDKDVLWVTPEVWEKLMVMSNLEWTIT